VEDNAINREVARELLQQAGLEVAEAHNGAEALAALDGGRFDLVLMDVQMPVMDGLDAVRGIRARPEVAHLPVVALTAHAMLGDRERFLAAGMNAYVSKPIDEAELFSTMARWLRVEGTAAPAAARASGDLPPSLAGLDVTGGLRRASGNVGLYRRLLVSFARDLDGFADRLDRELAKNDVPAALHLLHTLKGTSATVGAVTVARIAAGLETALRADGQTRPDLQPLDAACREAIASMATLAPVAVVNGGPDVPVDGATARQALPLLRELEQHLANSNLAATTTFSALKAVLGARLRQPVAELEACLERLDFEGATPHVQALGTALAAAESGA
jgi:two-component system, sensor histidine kinase and response regulator